MNTTNTDLEIQRSKRIGKKMLILAWTVLLGLLFMIFHWYEVKSSGAYNTISYTNAQGSIEMVIPLTDHNSYEAFGSINDQQVLLLIDTGANSIAVSQSVAEKAGLIQGMPVQISTAGGTNTAYLTKINTLYIGHNIHLQNINALINPNMSNDIVLLGMGALKQLDFKHSNKTLTLIQN